LSQEGTRTRIERGEASEDGILRHGIGGRVVAQEVTFESHAIQRGPFADHVRHQFVVVFFLVVCLRFRFNVPGVVQLDAIIVDVQVGRRIAGGPSY